MKKTKRLAILFLCLSLLLSGCSMQQGEQFMAELEQKWDNFMNWRLPDSWLEWLNGEDSGSSGPGSLSQAINGGSDDMPRFENMPYERPDLGKLEESCAAVLSAIEDGAGYQKLSKLLDKVYEFYYDYDTMYSLADIRSSLDQTDSYYLEEYDWCSENYYTVQQMMEEVFEACARCDQGKKLEKYYFWDGFCEEYGEDSQSHYYDEAVALMQQESALISDYRELMASPVIVVDGVEHDYYEYTENLSGAAYDEAERLYYEQYVPAAAEIFIDLVEVRCALAEELGYESYEQFAYEYTYERDYSPLEGHEYAMRVQQHIVPLYLEVVDEGLFGSVDYSYVEAQQLDEALDSATALMGGDIRNSFEIMSRYGLYDNSYSSKKLDMSYQIYLSNYEVPFLFMSPYCDESDYLTFFHEFGHYADAYTNYNAYETIDLSESFSQSMEYLSLFYTEDVLGAETVEKLKTYKLLDTLDMYVQQCSFAEFERRAYELGAENLSAEVLNRLSLELARDFGYLEEGYEDYYACSWIDIPHFFEAPFYVISYVVSNDVAMQIYALERQESGAGVDKFIEMMPRQYYGLVDSALSVGLEDPMGTERVEEIAAELRAMLQELK